MAPRKITVQDAQDGSTHSFDWQEDREPTSAEIESIVGQEKRSKPEQFLGENPYTGSFKRSLVSKVYDTAEKYANPMNWIKPVTDLFTDAPLAPYANKLGEKIEGENPERPFGPVGEGLSTVAGVDTSDPGTRRIIRGAGRGAVEGAGQVLSTGDLLSLGASAAGKGLSGIPRLGRNIARGASLLNEAGNVGVMASGAEDVMSEESENLPGGLAKMVLGGLGHLQGGRSLGGENLEKPGSPQIPPDRVIHDPEVLNTTEAMAYQGEQYAPIEAWDAYLRDEIGPASSMTISTKEGC